MFELIRVHQLNIMMGLSSVCFTVGFFTLLTRSLSKRRKFAIADVEFSSAILLFSDRLAYMYHGRPGSMAFWMVRIANFLVFFMTISVVHAFNLYLSDLCRNEIGLSKVPLRLKFVEWLCAVGWLLVILSQFIGLYYTFDENNAYQRGPGFLICYAIPFLALFIQLSVIFQYIRRLSLYISIPMILFTVAPMAAAVFQALFYGVSLTNMAIVGTGVVLYAFAILELNDKLEKAQRRELDEANKKSLSLRKSFGQVIAAVAKAQDERDQYTRGHSLRVAEYAKKIGTAMGLDDRECFRVYQAAALHDVGRIDLPDELLSRQEGLTDAQQELIRDSFAKGGRILSEVEDLPYLKESVGHVSERYDGKGVPEGLRGEQIPLYARIIAVANAYDEMTSYKASRKPLAQGKVRQNLIERSGREFDPKIVDIMVDMIDHDSEYLMREPDEESVEEADRSDITKVNRMHFDTYKELVSDGIRLTREYLKISFETRPDPGFERKNSLPALILFDSFDRCVHRNERNIKNLHYCEFGEIWMDGRKIVTSARDIKTDIVLREPGKEISPEEWIRYEIEAVCIGDHVKLKISSSILFADVTVALPDATRFVYLGLTGEHCSVRAISVSTLSLTADPDSIERIAPKVDYFDRKDGDIPNLEVNGYREEATAGLPVEDGMRLFFHTKALPEASMVYHCAYLVLFSSDDGVVRGKNYREFACIRVDGDDCTEEHKAENKLNVRRLEDFGGWDEWKEQNRRGLDCEVDFSRRKNRIDFSTENAGIAISCRSVVPEKTEAVYVALTGNLCTVSDIRIR